MMDTVIVTCPHCHVNNRLPRERLGQTAKCGKCGKAFQANAPETASPVTVTDATFTAEVLQSPLPVLVDVWAPWCGPCRMVAPVVEEIARDFAGRLKVVKLNSDENRMVPSQYQIQGIPTLLLLKNGQLVDRVVGAAPKAQLVNRIQQVL
jgi:thioredoxin 2